MTRHGDLWGLGAPEPRTAERSRADGQRAQGAGHPGAEPDPARVAGLLARLRAEAPAVVRAAVEVWQADGAGPGAETAGGAFNGPNAPGKATE